MRTICFSSYGGVSVQPPWMQTPPRQIPLEADPPQDADPLLGGRLPWRLVMCPVVHAGKPTPIGQNNRHLAPNFVCRHTKRNNVSLLSHRQQVLSIAKEPSYTC